MKKGCNVKAQIRHEAKRKFIRKLRKTMTMTAWKLRAKNIAERVERQVEKQRLAKLAKKQRQLKKAKTN